LLTIPNVGIETSIGKNQLFNWILGSPWKSINGKPQQFYVVIPEYRHFKENTMALWPHIVVLYLISRNGTI
jgi:hypothetical protein